MLSPQFKRRRNCDRASWPGPVRGGLIVLATLMLCSCQAADPLLSRPSPKLGAARGQDRPLLFGSAADRPTTPPSPMGSTLAQRRPNTQPPTRRFMDSPEIELTGYSESMQMGPSSRNADRYARRTRPGKTSACRVCDDDPNWQSGCGPSLACGIPRGPHPDELLCDGGDNPPQIGVRRNGTYIGLNQEDTIAQYTTVDGRIVVEPSNKVCLYAPRFAAVRRVVRIAEQDQLLPVHGATNVERSILTTDDQFASLAAQRQAPTLGTGDLPPSTYRSRQQGGEVRARISLQAMQDALLPYADFDVIRTGMVDNADKPRLAQSVISAISWAHDLGVQVVVDGQAAQIMQGDRNLEMVYRVDEPNEPRIRIVKLASRQAAQPGETVEFTLRFDNVGNREVDSVTIVDNLTTRLEYVPESQASSKPAAFSTESNDAGSLILRWDIHEPLQAGDGGIIRFTCRVR